jgi:hypothetical protein
MYKRIRSEKPEGKGPPGGDVDVDDRIKLK